MMTHTWNPGIRETEVGGSLCPIQWDAVSNSNEHKAYLRDNGKDGESYASCVLSLVKLNYLDSALSPLPELLPPFEADQ